jgi:hypothetical protein
MNNKTPQWLINIQENSWNVELFISIGFIFIFLRLPQQTLNLTTYITTYYGAFISLGILSWIIQMAVSILPIGFIAHLVFRGIWIGLVGFSYVFPEGIESSKLNFPEKYNRVILKSKSPIQNIILLENVCSLIYTFTFLLFFIFIAVFNYILISGICLEIINNNFGYGLLFQTVRLIFLFIGIAYAFDFITAGLLKKNRFFSKIFYPFYKVISIITFSRLYRTQYYTLITRFNKLWVSLVLFIIIFLYLISFYFFNIKTDKRVLYSNTFHNEFLIVADNYYENLIPEDKLISVASIQSDIIKDNYLKLFISHSRFWEYEFTKDELEKITNSIDSLEVYGGKTETYKYVVEKYNELYNVYLDDSLLENIDWLFYKHPKTVAGGIITYLNISDLSNGHHQIKIKILDKTQIASIHFWKQ